MRNPLLLIVVGLFAMMLQPAIRAADGGAAALHPPGPIFLKLPHSPFGVAATADDRWTFVAVQGEGRQGLGNGVALIRRDNDKFELKRVVPCPGLSAGIALSHDGKCLIVAATNSIVFLNTDKMISGNGDPLIAHFTGGEAAGSIYANVTPDDKIAFVSEEGGGSITVLNLKQIRAKGFDPTAIIGRIPVGRLPIALTFSPDGHWLYTTCEGALSEWGWAATAKSEWPRDQPRQVLPGAVLVVDVERARTDPVHAVVARVPAGSSPVRMDISPDGRRIYVTARGDNAVLVFDTAKLIHDPDHARLATVQVGAAPVPVAVFDSGKMLLVGNSNRYGEDRARAQTLSVIDTARVGQKGPVVGTIAAGSFPRAICVSRDGKFLFVTNYHSETLEIIDTRNMPFERK